VAAMSAFVEDIEEVGAAIELIALNASVKAARTGDQGRALGVLAQAIQKLSGEARERTAEVSRNLGEIAQASGKLEQRAASALDTSRLDQMAGREEGLMGRLRGVNQALLARLAAIREVGRTLSSEVDAAIRAANLDREICPSLDRAREEMRDLGATAREAAPLSTDTGRPQRLKELLSRYTMEVERLVHEAAFGLGGGPAAATAGGGSADVSGVDDNVELF
jgi:methyl-accepting chemotaxis protein